MQYEGKLYGKVAGKYIELDTHAEIERLKKRIAELEVLLKSLYENKLESDKLYIILSRSETKKLISEGGADE